MNASEQVRRPSERRRKAGIDGEDADEEESDDAEMNEPERTNYRIQPDEVPVQPSPGEDEASDHEYDHDDIDSDPDGRQHPGAVMRDDRGLAHAANELRPEQPGAVAPGEATVASAAAAGEDLREQMA